MKRRADSKRAIDNCRAAAVVCRNDGVGSSGIPEWCAGTTEPADAKSKGQGEVPPSIRTFFIVTGQHGRRAVGATRDDALHVLPKRVEPVSGRTRASDASSRGA